MDNKEIQSPQPQIEEEIWKTHSSGYEVSSFGRVKGKNVEFLKPSIDQDGYLVYHLNINNKGFSKAAHRLVGETFLGKIADNEVVNHKDGDKSNPKLSNLEIVTESENSIHAHRTGLSKPICGEDHFRAILSEEKVKEIYTLLKGGIKPSQIAPQYGVEVNCIRKIQRGETWNKLFRENNMIWNSVRSPKSKIDKELVKTILEKHKNGESKVSIAKELSLPESRINSVIKDGLRKSLRKLKKFNNFDKLSVESLEGEKWKLHSPTKRYVSNYGRVVGFFGKILKPIPDGQRNYLRVCLNRRHWRIHILVWETFKGEKPKGMEINHLDRNKENNRLDNLELVTPSQNSKHCCLTRKITRGAESPMSKLDDSKVREIRIRLSNGDSFSQIARDYGVTSTLIYYIKNNKIWTHVI